MNFTIPIWSYTTAKFYDNSLRFSFETHNRDLSMFCDKVECIFVPSSFVINIAVVWNVVYHEINNFVSIGSSIWCGSYLCMFLLETLFDVIHICVCFRKSVIFSGNLCPAWVIVPLKKLGKLTQNQGSTKVLLKLLPFSYFLSFFFLIFPFFIMYK